MLTMKIRQITLILLSGILILFSMCKKEVNAPANTGGGAGSGGNDNNPALVSFSPESGAIDDTVTITISNYTGDPKNLTVFFGLYAQAKVISVNTGKPNTVIKALVPETTDITTKINVKGDNKMWVVAENSFTETSPAIQLAGFSPANAFIGDTITLTGTFYKNTPKVKFGDVAARLISQDSKTLKVVVPDEITSATPALSVTVLDQTVTSTTSFHLNAPVIDSITPQTAYLGQVIRIKGKGFRNTFQYNQVYMDDSSITSSSESHTSIAVYTRDAKVGSHNIAVAIAGLKTVAKTPLNLIADIPPQITSIEDTVYAGSNVIIMGNHFLSPSPEIPTTVTTVDQNGNTINFTIQYLADNEIIVSVPRLGGNEGKYKITVTVLASSVTYVKPVTYYPN
jgi:hypothetical protein